MKIFFMEIIKGKMEIYSVDMGERATFWKEHPAAMEITWKQYNGLVDYLNKLNETKTT